MLRRSASLPAVLASSECPPWEVRGGESTALCPVDLQAALTPRYDKSSVAAVSCTPSFLHSWRGGTGNSTRGRSQRSSVSQSFVPGKKKRKRFRGSFHLTPPGRVGPRDGTPVSPSGLHLCDGNERKNHACPGRLFFLCVFFLRVRTFPIFVCVCLFVLRPRRHSRKVKHEIATLTFC